MDIFESRNISPMLIKNKNTNPFDDPDYIFELKLDGVLLNPTYYIETT